MSDKTLNTCGEVSYTAEEIKTYCRSIQEGTNLTTEETRSQILDLFIRYWMDAQYPPNSHVFYFIIPSELDGLQLKRDLTKSPKTKNTKEKKLYRIGFDSDIYTKEYLSVQEEKMVHNIIDNLNKFSTKSRKLSIEKIGGVR